MLIWNIEIAYLIFHDMKEEWMCLLHLSDLEKIYFAHVAFEIRSGENHAFVTSHLFLNKYQIK